MGLCKECFDKFMETVHPGYDRGAYLDFHVPWVHCHHEKTLKGESPCFCQKYEIHWHLGDIGTDLNCNFCPRCGRKLD